MDCILYLRAAPDATAPTDASLNAQKVRANAWATDNGARITASFVELEDGADRPALAMAIEECRIQNATLLIASIAPIGTGTAFQPRIRSVPVAIVPEPVRPALLSIAAPHGSQEGLCLFFGEGQADRRISVYLVNRTGQTLSSARLGITVVSVEDARTFINPAIESTLPDVPEETGLLVDQFSPTGDNEHQILYALRWKANEDEISAHAVVRYIVPTHRHLRFLKQPLANRGELSDVSDDARNTERNGRSNLLAGSRSPNVVPPRKHGESCMRTSRDRALGAMLGLAIGDALGAPLEFSKRDQIPAVRDMIGGGPFGLAPGQWTDDTSMALCLADALIAGRGTLDPLDLMRRFVRWWRQGENSVTGSCFDIGVVTEAALRHFEQTGRTACAWPEDQRGAGNGSLMRLAPVTILASPDLGLAGELADVQSRTTHTSFVAHDACRFLATLLAVALSGADKREVLRPRRYAASSALAPIARADYRTKARLEISSSGYVVHTLEAALWAVWNASSFEKALILAVNLGGDADTIGAVTGQLAGALWGKSAIPDRWLAKLAWREEIEARVDTLLAMRG